MTLKEVEDPELAALRRSIAEAVNRPFSEPLVQKIGFYKFNFMPL